MLLFISTVLIMSCSIAPPRADYTKEPLTTSYDKITQKSVVSSLRISDEQIQGMYKRPPQEVFASPYLVVSDKEKTVRVKLGITVDRKNGAVFFDRQHTLCDNEQPITRRQETGESWQKNLDVYSETGDIRLYKNQIDSILNCKNSLTIRVSSSSRQAETTYTAKDNPEYFRGLIDIKDHLDKLILQKFKILEK